jgi:putative methyltransferase (TIGR04325 family)
MTVRQSIESALKAWVPPALKRAIWWLFPRFRYLPTTDAVTLDAGGWNDESVVNAERSKWEEFRALVASSAPLGFSHEQPALGDVRNLYHHNIHLAFAFALARAAQGGRSVSVLDWGGGLGHYYLLARSLYPALELEYHVKEMPAIAAAGRELLPDVQWHDDDGCLTGSFDLVMVNGSLQYLGEWRHFLTRAAAATSRTLFLTRVPVVQRAAPYAARQSEYGTEMIHWQFNERQLLTAIQDTGLTLVREVLVGGSPFVRGAPEQPEMRGWLFER